MNDEQNKETNDQAEILSKELKKEAKPKKSSDGSGRLALLVGVIAIICFVAFYLNSYYVNSQTQLRLSQLQSQLSFNQQEFSKQIQVSQANRALLDRVNSVINGDQKDWMIADVGYLVNMAQLTLQYENDVPAALIMLKTADNHLRHVGILKLQPLHQAIKTDINLLEAVPKINTTKTYLELQTLGKQIEKLPLIPIVSDEQKAKARTNNTDKNVGWKNALITSWSSIKKVLVIRRHDSPVSPLLTIEQRNLLNVYVQTLFMQAQWALLHKNKMIYQAALQQADRTIKKYFMSNVREVKTVLANITALQKVDVAPAIPDVNNAIQELVKVKQVKKQLKEKIVAKIKVKEKKA